MTPFGELRLSLPLALTLFQLPWFLAYFLSVIGNLTVVILLLLFLGPLSCWFSKNFRICQRFFSWLFQRTRDRYNAKMKKYGYPALTLFVAIPLPITGGWTGALIAFLFGIPFKKAFPLIGLGVLIAGCLVLGAVRIGITIDKYLGWQALAGFLLAGGFGLLMSKMKSKKKLKTKPNKARKY